MEQQTCLECGERIQGRSDKKFCGDYCRNAHNNKVNKDSKNLIRNTNNRLRKNYKILTDLNSKGKTKVVRNTLNAHNFDFSLFTSIYTTKTGNVYYRAAGCDHHLQILLLLRISLGTTVGYGKRKRCLWNH